MAMSAARCAGVTYLVVGGRTDPSSLSDTTLVETVGATSESGSRSWNRIDSVPWFRPPVDTLDEQYPIRLTTGRRLDSFNTGVQSGRYQSPLRQRETLDLSPEDGKLYGVAEGEPIRVSSRRGSLVVSVRYDTSLRQGLAFMTMHFPEDVATNLLTIDAVDPKSGTAEFKATAIRIEKLRSPLESDTAAAEEGVPAAPLGV